MRNRLYFIVSSYNSKPMGSVIYGKIYKFGGHTNKPVKNHHIKIGILGSCGCQKNKIY